MNTEEHKEWYSVVKEAVKAELLSEGWTPPEEEKWVPKEGELVLQRGIPIRYCSYMGVDVIEPHPTHIQWKTGPLPPDAELDERFFFRIHNEGRWLFKTKAGGVIYQKTKGDWFWLEE